MATRLVSATQRNNSFRMASTFRQLICPQRQTSTSQFCSSRVYNKTKVDIIVN